MKAIVAVNNLNYIGLNGKMLWKSSEDFKHFKKNTSGNRKVKNILLIGATTFEQDLQSKELVDRKLIVIGSEYYSLNNAVRKAYLEQEKSAEMYFEVPDIWVIGGSSIYTQLMPLINEFHISYINDNQVGDKKFILPQDFRGIKHSYHFEVNSPK